MQREAVPEIGAREATDDEVAHFHAHGWVKMERLISPELASVMLERAKTEILQHEPDNAAAGTHPLTERTSSSKSPASSSSSCARTGTMVMLQSSISRPAVTVLRMP